MKKYNGTQKPTRRTLLDRAKHLLESGRFADVEFLVGENHGAKEVFSVFIVAFFIFNLKLLFSSRSLKPTKLY